MKRKKNENKDKEKKIPYGQNNFQREIVTSQPKFSTMGARNMLKRYPLTLCCIALIWLLCFCHPPQTKLDGFSGIDKLVHVGMYLVTSLVMWWEYSRSHTRLHWAHTLAWLVLLPASMSAVIELLQEYATSHRGGDWLDFVANSTGIALAALIGRCIIWPSQNRRNA